MRVRAGVLAPLWRDTRVPDTAVPDDVFDPRVRIILEGFRDDIAVNAVYRIVRDIEGSYDAAPSISYPGIVIAGARRMFRIANRAVRAFGTLWESLIDL
jgi:hypothetical protein